MAAAPRNDNGPPSIGGPSRGAETNQLSARTSEGRTASIGAPPATRRAFRRHRAQTVEWRPPVGSAAQLLDGLGADTERVYLLGPRPGSSAAGLRGWALDIPRGWDHDPAGHYMEGEGITLRYRRPDGRRVAVYRAAAWYGPDDHTYTPAQAAAAFALAGDLIRRAFDPRAQLLATPATTGRELLLRSIPAGREWPVMSPELQQLVRATSGQGRIQLMRPAAAELPQLVQLDGRLMYAALCWGLAAGEPVRSTGGDYLGQTRARYLVRFTVPRDWRSSCACGAPGHGSIGLLAVKSAGRARGWHYPADPGARHETWADGAELRVALRHGWRIDVRESIAWPASNVGPLDGWRRRLLAARQQLAACDGQVDVLAARALRAVILHGIGALHGAPHSVTRTGSPDQVPADARNLRDEGGALLWREASAPAWAALSHPEWSAAIWARARARLLDGPQGTGALNVPAAHVVAFRTDALYLAENPGWADDGAAGRFRLKSCTPGPIPWPSTASELLKQSRGSL